MKFNQTVIFATIIKSIKKTRTQGGEAHFCSYFKSVLYSSHGYLFSTHGVCPLYNHSYNMTFCALSPRLINRARAWGSVLFINHNE